MSAPFDDAPAPDALEQERERRQARVQAIHSGMRSSLERVDPAALAKQRDLATRSGVPEQVVGELDEGRRRALDVLPDVATLQSDVERDPALLDGIERSGVLEEGPDKYPDVVTVWNLASKLKAFGKELVGAVPEGIAQARGADELGGLGLELDRVLAAGEEPSADLLDRIATNRAQLANIPHRDPWSVVGGAQAVAMGGAQMFDFLLVDKRNTDFLARNYLGSEEGDFGNFLAESGLAHKVGVLAQVLVSAGGGARAIAVANTGVEAFQLEYGNMLLNLWDLKDGGLSPDDMRAYAMWYASVASVIESASTLFETGIARGQILNAKRRVMGEVRKAIEEETRGRLMKRVAIDLLKTSASEGTEEGLQAAAEVLFTGVAKVSAGTFPGYEKFGDAVAAVFSPEGLAQIIAEAKAGSVAALGFVGPTTTADVATGLRRVQRAEANAEAFKALAEGVKGSELSTRGAGAALADLVTLAGKDKADTLYIEADDLEGVLNQAGVDPNSIQDGLADEIALARAEERPVQFETGKFAVKLANSTLFDELNEHIRFERDGLSKREAADFKKQLQQTEKETLEALNEPDRVTFEKSSAALRDVYAQQIADTGRFTRSEGAAKARLTEQIYRGVAIALTNSSGKLVTPEQAAALKPLQVVGPDVNIAALARGVRDAEVLAQPEVVAAAVRVRDPATGEERVFEGVTHADAFEAADEAGALPDGAPIEDLFVTDDGRLLTREEAASEFAPRLQHPTFAPRGQATTEDFTGGQGFEPLNQDVAPILERAQPKTVADYDDSAWLAWTPEQTKGGKLKGAPEDVNSVEDWEAVQQLVLQLVREGEAGRLWYERSAEAVLQAVDGDFVLAEKLVQLLAIYSPQAYVPVNTMLAVRAFTQWRTGVPFEDFGVSSASKDATARAVLYEDQPFQGRKTNSFYLNLMHRLVELAGDRDLEAMKIEPELLAQLKGPVTSDMWVFRAYGYRNDKAGNDLGAGRYSFTENSLNNIAARLNQTLGLDEQAWLPHQVQAAMWTAIKARFEVPRVKQLTNEESLAAGFSRVGTFAEDGPQLAGKVLRVSGAEARRGHLQIWRRNALTATPEEVAAEIDTNGASFADVMERMTFAVTWEAVPSPSFDSPLTRADVDLKRRFADASARVILDEDGRDVAAALAGAPLNWTLQGDGGYALAVEPNNVAYLLPNKPAGAFSTEEASTYAAMLQYIYRQDAVPWFRVDPAVDLSRSYRVVHASGKTARWFATQREAQAFADLKEGRRVLGADHSQGVSIRFDRALTPEDVEDVFASIVERFGTGAGFTRTAANEVAVINFRGEDGLPFLTDDESFLAAVEEVGDQHAGTKEIIRYGVQSDYGPVHDWAADPAGEALLDSDRFAGRPDLQSWLRGRRAEAERVASEFEALVGERDRGADQGGLRERLQVANHRRLGLLGDDGEPVSLADLHQGAKNSESAQRAVYRAMGMKVEAGTNTGDTLKIYPLQDAFGDSIEEVEARLGEWLERIGWSYRVFGPKNGDRPTIYPDFHDPTTPTYEQGVVWIFDPALDEGSFRDHAYTLAWRVTHEVAHGIVNERLTQKYGGRGRRAGAMGVEIKGPYFKGGDPLTLADAMRAVEWEAETFVEQRRILEEEFGISIEEDAFRKENAVNLSDAVYRAITGQFGNPGEIGVVPTALDPQEALARALDVLRQISIEINGDSAEVLDDGVEAAMFDSGSANVYESAARERGGEPRGQFVNTAQGAIIRLTQATDLTSFEHELAHFYLTTVTELVRDGLADERMQRDFQTIMSWLDVTDPTDLTRPYADGRLAPSGEVDKPHEVFARGFEAYLAEGVAPSRKMEGAFARFASWVAGVYRGVKDMAAFLGVQLNDEVRGVYDRMVDLEGALDALNEDDVPLFETREQAGLTDDQWRAWQEEAQLIRAEQRNRALAPYVKRVRAERARARRELRAALTEKYGAEVDGERVYVALKELREGEGLSRSAVLAMHATPEAGKAALRRLPRGTLAREGGVDPQVFADAQGWGSAGEMLNELSRAPARGKEVRRRVDAEIASREDLRDDHHSVATEAKLRLGGEEARQRLYRRELAHLRKLAERDLTPAARRAVAEVGAPSAEASRASVTRAREALERAQQGGNAQVVAEAQTALLAAEAAAQADTEARRSQGAARRRLRELEALMDEDVLRGRARRLVANRPAGDLDGDRRVWGKRMKAAHKAARDAVASRDYLAAARHLERAMLLNEAIREAGDALTRQPKILEHARSFDRSAKRDQLRAAGAGEELALIDALRDRYDLRNSVPLDPALTGPERARELARRRQLREQRAEQSQLSRDTLEASLLDWATRKSKALEVVDIDEKLAINPDRKHWRELTVSELDGLSATLRNMEHLAREEVKAAREAERVSADQVADQVVHAMQVKNGDRRAADPDEGWGQKLKGRFEKLDALHIKMPRLFRWMAGDDRATNPLIGIAERWDDAQIFYLTRSRELTNQYEKLIDALHSNGADYLTKVSVPALRRFYPKGLDRRQIVGFALEMGTQSNYNKTRDGYGLTDDQVNEVLALVRKDEWEFVQSVWDLIGGLWPEIEKNHYQNSGVHPAKVELRQFIAPTGQTMKGGYFPIQYDRSLDRAAQRRYERSFIENMFESYASAPSTRHGFTESRKEGYSAPVQLDLDVIAKHLDDVIYDLAWRAPLRDSWRIFHRPQLKAAIIDMYGANYFDAIEHRMRKLARETEAPSLNLRGLERGIRSVSSAYTAYALSGALSTILVQPSAIVNGIPRIDPGNARRSTALLFKNVKRVALDFRATREWLFEKSPYMRERVTSNDASIRELNDHLKGDRSLKAEATRFGYSMIGWADYFTSAPIWLSRYEVVLQESGDHALAVREADFAVERTQGSGSAQHLAQIQDSSPLLKPFTLFYSYFNAQYNELHAIAEDVADGDRPLTSRLSQAALSYVLIFVLPSLLADVLRARFPEPDDDEEEWEAWAEWLGEAFVFGPFNTTVFFRDVSSYVQSRYVQGRYSDFEISPLAGVIDQYGRTFEVTVDAVSGEEEVYSADVAANAVALVGQTKGVPFTRQVETVLHNIARAQESGQPLGPLDLLRRRRKEQ